jgi:hypothetical protein
MASADAKSVSGPGLEQTGTQHLVNMIGAEIYPENRPAVWQSNTQKMLFEPEWVKAV